MENEQAFDAKELQAGNTLFTKPCQFVLSAARFDQIPAATMNEIAFAGRSNVGKSSLLNALFNQKTLAKTSSTPGRTQQLNYFNLNDQLYIVDLPGYGFAKAPDAAVKQWQKIIFEYLRGRPNLRRVFLMIDSRHGLKPIDHKTMDLLDEAAVCYQIVLTKIDKISAAELQKVINQIMAKMSDHPAMHQRIIATSSTKKTGLENLRAEIAQLVS